MRRSGERSFVFAYYSCVVFLFVDVRGQRLYGKSSICNGQGAPKGRTFWKACTKTVYIGSFAEQLINGVNIIVIFLSLSEGKVRLAIIAGTEQPNITFTGAAI